ncbi:MAG: hypothetical protein AAB478_01610 [Patescibacteria group bacterium]
MKKKKSQRKHISHRAKKRSPRRLHHRVISFFRGDGGIYVILLLGVTMAGAFALSGGILPQLNPNPSSADQVQIDEDSAKRSSESALQLVDIKIKPTDTPVPTPTENPTSSITPLLTSSITPSPSTIKECLDRSVITMMIDLSASMGNDHKIDALNTALVDFTGSLQSTNAVVGGIAFGAPSAEYTLDNIEGVKLLSNYTSNKTNVTSRFTNLKVGPTGGTYMRNGYKDSVSRLTSYKSNHQTQNNHYISIIFSDGVPEILDDLNPTCLGGGKVDGVCWARQQDPRKTPFGLNSTDYITLMDGLVNKSYAVAIYDSRSAARGAGLTDELTTLLHTAASSSKAPYYQSVDLKNGPLDQGELKGFFNSIVKDACS